MVGNISSIRSCVHLCDAPACCSPLPLHTAPTVALLLLPPVQDPGGTLARRCLQAVVGRLGAALASPHSWQHRELRNPLGDASLPPALQLPPSGALAVQSLCNLALQAPAPPGEPRPVAGVLLLHGPHLLWSSLPPRDTAAVFSLIATGLLHASASSSGSGAANGSAASSGGPDLSALDGGCWQQLPSGFLALRDSLDAAITGEGAPAVQLPLLHLQQPPSSTSSAGGGEDGGGEQQQAAAAAIDGQRLPQQLQPGYRLLPLLEGKLLVGLLLAPGVTPTAQLLASLHALLAVPARLLAVQVRLWWGRVLGRCACWAVHASQLLHAHPAAHCHPALCRPTLLMLCKQVGEEVRQAYRGEAGHLPGFRYLHQDGGRGVAHASPRVKVSAMSHHARTLAAALRTSLGRGPEAGGDAEALGEWGEEGVDADGLPTAEQQQQPSAAAGAAGMQAPGDHEILEVLAKSGQDVWAAAWRPGDGRQLLAVRERRAERELPEAGEAMAAFAARNFMI